MVAIPDRGGFKCRGITISDSVVQQHATPLRRTMYKRILSNMECRAVLFGDYSHSSVTSGLPPPSVDGRSCADSFYSATNRETPYVILSADLTAATDYFPFEFQDTFNRSFFKASEVENTQVRAWNWLSRPHRILYPRLPGEVKDLNLLQTRGTLMGTVPSWFHLNALNCFIIRLSYHFMIYASDKKGRCWDSLFSVDAFTGVNREWLLREVLKFANHQHYLRPLMDEVRICGDDLQAVLPIGAALAYEVLVHSYGGKLSEGKHYVFRLPASPMVGPHLPYSVFAETFRVYGKNCSNVPAPPLRSVTGAIRQDWRDMGSRLQDMVDECSSSIEKRALLSLSYSYNSRIIGNIRSSRPGAPALPFFLPRTYGGMGCPDIHGDVFRGKVICPSQLRLIINLRSLRTDPVRFAMEVLKIRFSWYIGPTARVGPWLKRIDEDVVQTMKFPTSREHDGSLGVCKRGFLGTRSCDSDVLLPCAILNVAAKLASVAAVDEYTSSTRSWEDLNPTGRQMTIHRAKVNFRVRRTALNSAVAKNGITVAYRVGSHRRVARSNAALDNIPPGVWRDWERADRALLEGLYINKDDLREHLASTFSYESIKDDLDHIFEDSSQGEVHINNVGFAPFEIKAL